MHAASVHPEPGSNSRNHCIKTSCQGWSKLCLRVLLLASFTFCLSSILIQRIVEIRIRTYLYALYFSLVVQFSRIIASLRFQRRATLLLYHFYSRLSIPFLKLFSKSFLRLRQTSESSSVFATARILYYFDIPLSSTFFTFFRFFLLFGFFHSFYATFCTTFWRKSIQHVKKDCCFIQFLDFFFVYWARFLV